MSVESLLKLAIQVSDNLPNTLRSEAVVISEIGESQFDESYIQFLSEHIELEPRDPEWTQVLSTRRDNLQHYVGFPLITCTASASGSYYRLWVNLETVNVVHCEAQ